MRHYRYVMIFHPSLCLFAACAGCAVFKRDVFHACSLLRVTHLVPAVYALYALGRSGLLPFLRCDVVLSSSPATSFGPVSFIPCTPAWHLSPFSLLCLFWSLFFCPLFRDDKITVRRCADPEIFPLVRRPQRIYVRLRGVQRLRPAV